MKEVTLTTVDNPFDPFEQFTSWLLFDKEKGYNTTRLRKEKLLAESTIQQLREGKLVSWKNVDRLCTLLGCQLSDILEHVEDVEGERV